MTTHKRHFLIGRIGVSLVSECRRFVEEYASLYKAYERADADHDAIRVRVTARRNGPWARGPFTIHTDSIDGFDVRRRHEVLPHIEWLINWEIIQSRTEFVQLHASTLVKDGAALLMPGHPGSGKSTLTAGLLARGWSYLCDEFALIDPERFLAEPFPRAICVKEPSFAVIDALGLPLRRKTPYRKPTKGRVAFLNPLDVRPDIVGAASPVRWVVFPKYEAGATPMLTPMSKAEAVFEALRQCFNFCAFEGRALGVMAQIMRGAACFRLTVGQIGPTCDLIEALLDDRAVIRRQCA